MFKNKLVIFILFLGLGLGFLPSLVLAIDGTAGDGDYCCTNYQALESYTNETFRNSAIGHTCRPGSKCDGTDLPNSDGSDGCRKYGQCALIPPAGQPAQPAGSNVTPTPTPSPSQTPSKPLLDWEGFCAAYCKASAQDECTESNLGTALSSSQIATNPEYNCAKGKTTCLCSAIDAPDIPSFLNTLMGWMFNFALVASILMVLVGAFYMMISAGEPERTNKGRSIIVWAMVGLAVILSARLLSAVISMILAGPSPAP